MRHRQVHFASLIPLKRLTHMHITGQATTELTPFKRATGVDPSEKMIEGARSSVAALGLENPAQFDFIQSSAESLGFLEDGTVDLITAGK